MKGMEAIEFDKKEPIGAKERDVKNQAPKQCQPKLVIPMGVGEANQQKKEPL